MKKYLVRIPAIALSTVAVLVCCSCATSRSDEPGVKQLITHPLQIAAHATVSLPDGDAAAIVAATSQILSQCNARASMAGPVNTFTVGTGTINSQADFDAVGATFKGVPRRVRVVNALNWCSTFNVNIIGCAPQPGTFLVVERRSTIADEGILWAHEFGHTKGLPHRDDVGAVMRPVAVADNTLFNGGECQSIRSLSRVLQEGSPTSSNTGVTDVSDFVRQQFFEGVPYLEAKKYPSADAQKLLAILADPNQAKFWATTVAVLAIISDGSHAGQIINFIQSDIGVNSDDAVRGKQAAILALGFVLNKTNQRTVLNFLKSGLDASNWDGLGIKWKATFHRTIADRNWHLVGLSVIALGLSGVPEGQSALQTFLAGLNTVQNPSVREHLVNTSSEALRAHAIIVSGGLERYYSK